LVDWAVPQADAAVLDPAAGDGAFLLAGAKRLRSLGTHRPEVVGVELRPDAAQQTLGLLGDAGLDSVRLVQRDFLDLSQGEMPRFDAVVGNPPFVRYQRVSREKRLLAAKLAEAAGAKLASVASSWAAFVIHASSFLRPGGRLALVLPAELGHARYARDVLAFLGARFAKVRFVLFERPLFPQLDQAALLLTAEGYGRPGRDFAVACLVSPAELGRGLAALDYRPLDPEGLITGSAKLHHAWLPAEAADLLSWLRSSRQVSRLGHHARVMIGYVSAANDYFHLAPDQALELGLAAVHLRRAVFRSRALAGLEFVEADWRAAAERGDAGLLFAPVDESEPEVAAYLAAGKARGLPQRAKARHRTPWWRVTRTAAPDLLMTSMAAGRPRLSVNAMQAAVCNTLHAVWRRTGSGAAEPRTLAAAALSSLTELSAELEGHALGGGLLKLEPSAAQAVLLPVPANSAAEPEAMLWRALDRLARSGDLLGARAAADAAFLSSIPGVGPRGAELLGSAADRLRELRTGRPARPQEVGPG